MPEDLDTSRIKDWRSIVTLIVFVITNIIVVFPFPLRIYVPRLLSDAILDILGAFKVIAPRKKSSQFSSPDSPTSKRSSFVQVKFPFNFVTAPLIADLFLLAIKAIGRQEVHDGTIGANNISPIDIMLFFLSLAYIAISIDASGLIRYLAFKVLEKGGDVGHKLFFYLYAFFFGLAGFIGNDPIILSGTAFLAYMTRVSSNIKHPRAWIFSQFAVANIASAILVSSNPTNLVLAGAFDIKFIDYTANMIVPVIVTGIVLFPFLLYFIFADDKLIPPTIKMHELPPDVKGKKPVNPNIPHAKGMEEEQEFSPEDEETGQRLSLEEIMNPFLDKGGAAFGAVIMAVTLITLLALDAASARTGKHAVFWVTLPAAFVMLCWDIAFGWWHREETRYIARKGREDIEHAHIKREIEEKDEQEYQDGTAAYRPDSAEAHAREIRRRSQGPAVDLNRDIEKGENAIELLPRAVNKPKDGEMDGGVQIEVRATNSGSSSESSGRTLVEQTTEEQTAKLVESRSEEKPTTSVEQTNEQKPATDIDKRIKQEMELRQREKDQTPQTLVSLMADAYRWSQETFPTATAVLGHLPFALVPFAFSMFVLVQALVTKGWVPVFAYGWYHWVSKTSTMGAIGGMGLLSVILCNFAGTNIGATILLSRVIQAWQEIHRAEGVDLSNRTFWATVYSMAIGVNYGAFSAAFSASLAGLLWRDILARKHIHAKSLDFARVNLPIIAICMVVGCGVLAGEVYVMRDKSPYNSS